MGAVALGAMSAMGLTAAAVMVTVPLLKAEPGPWMAALVGPVYVGLAVWMTRVWREQIET